MNVLFVLYGPLSSNSGVPLALHARELTARGHRCAVALPPPEGGPPAPVAFAGCVATFDEALRHPGKLFPDGRPADVVHAWTPRENVRWFVTAWLARHPAPLVVYLEDNERCIALEPLGEEGVDTLLRADDADLAALLPVHLPHPLRFESFVGLADAAVVIQDKLAAEVPGWVPSRTVMPGVDLALFAPQAALPGARERHGLRPDERVIVYPGGLNPHTRGPIRALCEAVALLNRRGVPCRLLRTGPTPLDFLSALPADVRAHVVDLGLVRRTQLPRLLALADVLVQPGRRDPFEDLRLPGKVPEFLAMGKPVVLPDANVAHLLTDGENALLTRTGSAEEIAQRCLQVFADPSLARKLGAGARRFAESTFDPAAQAGKLLAAYEAARAGFDALPAQARWTGATPDLPPALLLARRLQELPAASVDAAQVLPLHQDLLARARRHVAQDGGDPVALRRVLRERCAETALLQPLGGEYAQVLSALEDRLVLAAPVRNPGALQRAGRALRLAGGLVRRVLALARAKGGAAGLLASAWRIAGTEGWGGVRRRLAALSTSARLAAGRRHDAERRE